MSTPKVEGTKQKGESRGDMSSVHPRIDDHADENVDTVESKDYRTVREISRAAGVCRSSFSRIIHKDLRLRPNCCKKRRAKQLTEAHSMHALFSVCSDDNMIQQASKPT